jgi:hypothetical protein
VSNIEGPTKKKTVSDQSIPVKDRIQATIRNPQYLVDWGTYNKNFMDYISKLPDHQRPREEDCLPEGPEDNPVAKKWNIPFPEPPLVSPRQGSHYSNGNNQCSCDILEDQTPRYIEIRVHLEAPVQDIQKDVMKLVNDHREASGIKNRAPRPTKEVDMWKVYDIKMRDKSFIMEIARAWWPEEELGNPSYDANAKNKWEQVSRAIKKATQLVQRVEKEAAKNNIPLRPHPKMYKNFS